MKAGIRIRASTLELHVQKLAQSASMAARPTQARHKQQAPSNHPAHTSLHLRPNSTNSQSTQAALSLLLAARQYRHRRTERMYKDLIAACILNGEIIVAALLFGLIVRDWQHKAIQAAQEDTQERLANPVGVSKWSPRTRPDAVYPSPQLMRSILQTVETGLSQTSDDPSSKDELRRSLQALAHFAMLLDERQLPFPALVPLIQALMRCPRVDEEVSIIWKGVPRQVNAYRYFHSVLKRLIEDLPTKKPSTDSSLNDRMPPLSLSSYNTLLQYAYRYRHSTRLGGKIFDHMSRIRDPPLKPDTVTYNIMLRSGTLLRQPDITKLALDKLRERPKSTESDASTTAFGSLEFSSLSPDIYTITSFITYLASTNRADDVAAVLFDILPELSIISHPSWAELSVTQRHHLFHQSRAAYMERAVKLGPWFFAALLNALQKAGKTGLTERVWFLAKAAERASWNTKLYPQVKPWCLPVHAYTSMMKCYAAEGRKGQKVRRLRNLSRLLVSSAEMAWEPIAEEKQHVRGWALFVVRAKKAEQSKFPRSETARVMGSLLFREMQLSVRAVYASLLNLPKSNQVPKGVQIPRPDSRFFNAALNIFARHDAMRPRAIRTNSAHWRRHVRLSTKYYARFGIKSRYWTTELEQVSQTMHEHGFKLPASVQKMAVGNWSPNTAVSSTMIMTAEALPQEGGGLFHQAQSGCLPWTSRRRRKERFRRPHSLSTVKTRGLHCKRR